MLSYKDLLAEQGALLDEMADRHVEVQKSIDAAVIKEQSRMIRRAMIEIYNQANTWFVKYAGNEGISVSEAKKRAAAADIEALSKKAAAYSANRHYKEFAFSEQANAEMALFNLTMKTSRAELQLRELQLSLIKLNDYLSVSTLNHLYSNTEAELVRLAGIMGKSVLTGSNIASVTETIVNGKGQYGTDFRDTIWNNVSGAQKVLEAGIRQSLIQGKNPRTWASSLKGFVDQTQLFLDRKIEIIAITETAMRQDEARKLIAKRAGFTFYRIRTERDSRRCEICARFDEYIGSYKDLAEGVNAPLFHARCRCQADPYEYTEAQNDEDFAALEDYINRLRAANSIEQVKEELYGYDPVAWLGSSAPKFEMNILP